MMEENLIGSRCRYRDMVGEIMEGTIVYVEPFGANCYLYIRSDYGERNIHQTTLEGRVEMFEYCDIVISDNVEVLG